VTKVCAFALRVEGMCVGGASDVLRSSEWHAASKQPSHKKHGSFGGAGLTSLMCLPSAGFALRLATPELCHLYGALAIHSGLTPLV